MGMLPRLYAWGLREKLITCTNPVLGVTRPKESQGCPDFLDDEQIGKLIAHLERHCDPILHAMVVLCLFSGIRKGEALGLTWRDVHTDVKRLDVEHSYDSPTKNGVVASVKLHDATIPVLNRWRNIAPANPLDLVFPVRGRDGSYGMGNEAHMFGLHEALQAALGRDWRRPWHLLRHSFASALVRRGVPLYDVGKLLRDKNPMVAMRCQAEPRGSRDAG